MADSLFDDTEDQFDENKDYLAELTKPGGKFDRTKYASEADMYKAIAKGKVLADRTLDHKNRDFDELREDSLKWRAEATAKARFDEFFEQRFKDSNTTKEPDTTGDVEQPILDEKKVEDLLEKKLFERETRKIETDNLKLVDQRLRERFGDNARAILKDKMNDLKISDEDLKFLAKKSPEAVFNALGLNQQQVDNFQAPIRSSIRSDNFTPQGDIRDALFYENLRKTDPKKYFDPKISVQRLKDMENPDFMKRYNSR